MASTASGRAFVVMSTSELLAIEERVADAAADEVALVPGVGEQARQLLHRRRRVEQRLETGRERGHSHHCRRPERQTRETYARIPTGPGPLRYVRSVEPAPACSRLGCDEAAVAVFAFDARESLVWLDPDQHRSRRRRPLPASRRPDVAAPRLEPPRPPGLRVPALDRAHGRGRGTGRPRAAPGTPGPLTPLRDPRAVAAVRRDAGAGGRCGRVGGTPHVVTARPSRARVRARARRPHADARPRVRRGATGRPTPDPSPRTRAL